VNAITTTETVAPDLTTEIPWDRLRGTVSGRLHLPGDAEWVAVSTPWIVNVPQRPAAVLEVADPQDVVTAVRFAADHGIAVTAQPRGHAARTTLDGALLLRTRALDTIDVDIQRGTARVGAGVKWGELMARLDGTGLVALCGSNPDPSVVGLTLGGGVSWFTRKYGFTANSVVSFDVVDPCGDLVTVTRTSDPDLFWALRGGGGDFGIVVSIELALMLAPSVYGGKILWPVEHAAAVLKAFRDLALTAPDELSIWGHVWHFPPLPELPEPIRGRSFVGVVLTHLGTAAEAEALLRPLRDAAPVAFDLVGPVPPSGMGMVAQEPTEPMPSLEYATTLTELDDAAIDRIVAVVGDRERSPLIVTQLRGLGGGFARTSPGSGAVAPVEEPFQLFAVGVPAVPELAQAIPAAFRALDEAVEGLATGHAMPNFTPDGAPNSVCYPPETLERLRRIKLERDPQGTIRSNKPVLGD
jgi:FAD/FMN-containing dehydrogenase